MKIRHNGNPIVRYSRSDVYGSYKEDSIYSVRNFSGDCNNPTEEDLNEDFDDKPEYNDVDLNTRDMRHESY